MKSSKHRRSLEGGDSIDIQNEDEPQISGMNGQGDQNEDSKTPYNHEEVKRPNSARPGHRKPSARKFFTFFLFSECINLKQLKVIEIFLF